MGLTVGSAPAGVIINIDQVGSDVVATASGTINLTDLTYDYSGFTGTGIAPIASILSMGNTALLNVDVYTSITGPTSFGPGGFTSPSTGVGSKFSVYENLGYLEVPQGYVSGTLLSATDTYSGATFSSLGITPGTYTWTWGTGANADFITASIGPSSVPEPSSLVLSGIAVAGVMAYMGGRRKAGRA